MSAGPITLSLEGRAALITGAATGIGRACALAFAQAGAHVVVNHCGQESLAHALVAELRDRDLQAWAVDADVSSSSAIQAIQAQVQSFAPPIDILLNNAGIMACPQLETKVVLVFVLFFRACVRWLLSTPPPHTHTLCANRTALSCSLAPTT